MVVLTEYTLHHTDLVMKLPHGPQGVLMNQTLIQLILIATKIMKVAPGAVCFSAQMQRRNRVGYKSVQYDAGEPV